MGAKRLVEQQNLGDVGFMIIGKPTANRGFTAEKGVLWEVQVLTQRIPLDIPFDNPLVQTFVQGRDQVNRAPGLPRPSSDTRRRPV